MARVALYIRVSTEEQTLHGLSLDAQQKALEDYANRNNYDVIDYYIDAGITARKRLSNRKELSRLIEDVKVGKIDLIIFTKLDRWFRNIADYYKVQEILDKYKVNWKTIFEDYDTSTANGRLHINIMLSIAQDEADRTSERIKAVFAGKRMKGEVTNNKAPIGYKVVDSKLIVDEEKRQIAVDMFNWYDTYHSLYKCCRMVTEKYGIVIYEYSMRRNFENRTYIGEFNGIQGFCEPIIDVSLFNRIQSHRNQREFKSQLASGRVYLFSGLIRCSECNHIMVSNYKTQQNKDGLKEYHYYKCSECLSRGHIGRKRANEDKVEQYLLSNLESAIKGKLEVSRTGKKEVVKKHDITKLKRRLDKLKDLYLDDLIDKETYKLEYESLNKQLAYVPELSVNEKYSKIDIRSFRSIYDTLTLEERKALWLGIIDKIIFDQNGEIRFYLK